MKSQTNYFYKKYDTIRKVLRKIYLYGCYNRSDYSEIASARKFDNELKRITMLFGGEKVVQKYKNKSKYTAINYQYFDDNENFLANSYYAKAFSDNEFKLYFLFLQLLNNSKPQSLVEIEKSIAEFTNNIDRATIRNHLDKMVDDGYLNAQMQGNKKLYCLASDYLKDYVGDELVSLLTEIQFAKNVMPIKMLGNYAFITIKLYLKDKYNVDYEGINLIFRHSYPHQILDEEVALSLYNAINKKQTISFNYGTVKKDNVLPFEMINDNYFGRQYLLAYDQNADKNSIFRLDKIENISLLNKYFDMTTEPTPKSWSITVKDTEPENISIDFVFDESTELYSIKRLYRECKHGEVCKIDDIYRFSVALIDASEMLPWLRTFYGNIKDTNNKKLKKLIKSDLEKMEVAYALV